MTVGIHAVNLANKWLNILRGVAFTPPAGTYIQLHTADPQGAGTVAIASVATRSPATFAAAASGALALTGTNPSWNMTGSETITHISVWDAATGGNFLWSAALAASKTVAAGDTLTLTTCGLSLGALAA
jgi:hypothetical protein